MKMTLTAPLMMATLLFSAASFAGMSSVALCNDCSKSTALEAAMALENNNVYVVDFVKRTAQKYVSDSKGNTIAANMSLGEITRLNQQFDYRKTYLHAVKH
ncbi:hypothetical protein L2729_10320 [Shewanella gelidimarina]|uniref:hypothetical protein n=1 Tax=Shewanella gelidimarina TaxID=56813 RepID=UPI00200E7CA9|nr:hypothetical protein [Shewanella gelidimarina]MCL1058386.1 hypothetical protein [Shewanella gelidimarina]